MAVKCTTSLIIGLSVAFEAVVIIAMALCPVAALSEADGPCWCDMNIDRLCMIAMRLRPYAKCTNYHLDLHDHVVDDIYAQRGLV